MTAYGPTRRTGHFPIKTDFTLMNDIFIYDSGIPISRISFGQAISGLGPVMEAYATRPVPVYVVADANVESIADEAVSVIEKTDAFRRGDVAVRGKYLVGATEESKTMRTVLDICGWLLGSGADRNAFILAVGGGITTDMAGFAASVYKRGVRFAYVPTTLLSQVDAAIGGKTGVNYDSYKNMLGVIRQPEFTYICAPVLESLPQRDLMSGMAELVKSFIIEDNGNYRRAVEFLGAMKRDGDCRSPFRTDAGGRGLLSLIYEAAAVKAGVVSRDQFETGERRKLNLGHTFAHAIEKNARSCVDDITHGEAVSMGIVLAAELAEATGTAPRGFASGLRNDFIMAALPVDCPYPVESLAEAMKKDKKAENGAVHFILPAGIGDVRICDLTADEAVSALKTFRAGR